MNKFRIVYSRQADRDMDDLTDAILYKYKAPLTAFRYIQGLKDSIEQLHRNAEVFPFFNNEILIVRFGANIRRINYKKMAIIYTVHDKIVYIHRILPANLIITS
ncbi:MAG TPA: hypothetical protein DDZ96_01815 [Porphyromonadaceae bacterium]|jgi:plasmid stabilization system protein ParE|uniref:type II toxin-antitoxin system RelE/ParE family toxin n=1 Tax=Limibacterium fermenti TaxID=3229863 RepID=UPI000E88FE5A|nr:hypothetical protein [Porphyromonadaceae bacterium]HBL32543.1 hypothetical protein [Porphyromonadaceae bacterium]HBX45387.1 hypothetical protein [Porphyromonadaceae bacterium]HCM20102.1 hypothetical protein [Porphyromonadaceae bacterium]